ncbi:MAG: hypothetical protein K8U57_15080 [Planctomycetes bacterium]|nr:hypothetical protein [Planctomycetota bacterium]
MKNKVPQVVFAFWLIKISATTLGETSGDALSMSLELGYAVSTAIFLALFLVAVTVQVSVKKYHPLLYWAVIVATTTVGTTTADYLTRDAGLGYFWASLFLLAAVVGVLALWYYSLGTVSVDRITNRKAETFYWVAILCSNTLGTALGDWLADTQGFGFGGGALVFGGMLALIAVAYFFTNISHTALFWAAFVLTRPLGATLGDLLTKPIADGGLDLSRIASSVILAIFMIGCILLTSRKSEQDVHSAESKPVEGGSEVLPSVRESV